MNIEINAAMIIYFMTKIALVIPRVSGIVVSLPVISNALNPKKIKVLFIFLLSFFIASDLNDDIFNDYQYTTNFLSLINEFFMGFTIGYIFQFVFQSLVVAGQIISLQAGLSFATLIDPATKSSVPLLSQFYLIFVSLIFLSINGHLYVIDLLVKSFQYIHVGKFIIEYDVLWKIIVFSSVVFKGAIIISIPAIISLLVVSISFGIMMKAAPQINIFSVGFPITLMLGVTIIFITIKDIYPQIDQLFNIAIDISNKITKNG